MKLEFHERDNDSEDTLLLRFDIYNTDSITSGSIVDKRLLITNDFIVGINTNNELLYLEVLNYTRNRGWVNDLLLENDLPGLIEDDVVIFIHQGYQAAYFNKNNIINDDAPCKYFCEPDEITQISVKQFLQDEVDLYLYYDKTY